MPKCGTSRCAVTRAVWLNWPTGSRLTTARKPLANPLTLSPQRVSIIVLIGKGDVRAANNAAMSCFNRNDMIGYRRWLRRAARAGDVMAAKQLRRFETRLWHADARKVGRPRPEQRRDEFA